jgi:mono/diheme cytochrome c family protein
MSQVRSPHVVAAMLMAGAVAAVTACAQDPTVPAPGERTPAQEGRLIAQRECSRCHATGPAGSSPRPDAPPLRDVLDHYSPERIEMSFREGLIIGHPDMPVFDFAPEQIEALLAYLEDIDSWQGPSGVARPTQEWPR